MENIYQKTVSQSAWPRDDVLESFIETYISILDNSTLAKGTYDFFSRMVPVATDDDKKMNKSSGHSEEGPKEVKPYYSKIR